MTDAALTIGCFEYDTTRPLFDGSVTVDGVDVTMETAATLPEIFARLIRRITEPSDLAGTTIGEFGTYGQDSGVWAKGILADEYGFKPEASRWVIGGLEYPAAPFDFIPHPHPGEVDVTVAPVRHLGQPRRT
jgi:4,5-dihydroxyphthalate decarboxylase